MFTYAKTVTPTKASVRLAHPAKAKTESKLCAVAAVKMLNKAVKEKIERNIVIKLWIAVSLILFFMRSDDAFEKIMTGVGRSKTKL